MIKKFSMLPCFGICSCVEFVSLFNEGSASFSIFFVNDNGLVSVLFTVDIETGSRHVITQYYKCIVLWYYNG